MALLNSCGHRWRATNRAVGFHEIVIGKVQRDGGFEIFELFGKGVRQPCESATVHSQRVILFFHVARGDQINHGRALHWHPRDAHHFGRGIAPLFLKLSVSIRFNN